jgi:hypothetical protein
MVWALLAVACLTLGGMVNMVLMLGTLKREVEANKAMLEGRTDKFQKIESDLAKVKEVIAKRAK